MQDGVWADGLGYGIKQCRNRVKNHRQQPHVQIYSQARQPCRMFAGQVLHECGAGVGAGTGESAKAGDEDLDGHGRRPRKRLACCTGPRPVNFT